MRRTSLLLMVSLLALVVFVSCSADSTFVTISTVPSQIAKNEKIELSVTTTSGSRCSIIWDGPISVGTYPNRSAQRGSISAGSISNYPDYPYDDSDQRRPWAILKKRPGVISSSGEDVLSLQIMGQKLVTEINGKLTETGGRGTVYVLCQSPNRTSEARATVSVNVQ